MAALALASGASFAQAAMVIIDDYTDASVVAGAGSSATTASLNAQPNVSRTLRLTNGGSVINVGGGNASANLDSSAQYLADYSGMFANTNNNSTIFHRVDLLRLNLSSADATDTRVRIRVATGGTSEIVQQDVSGAFSGLNIDLSSITTSVLENADFIRVQVVNLGGASANYSLASNLEAVATPEPAECILALLCALLVGMAVYRRYQATLLPAAC